MEIVTSWMEQGLQQGRQQGRQEGELVVVTRLLQRKLGNIEPTISEQIAKLETNKLEELAEAILDFNSISDLQGWLNNNK